MRPFTTAAAALAVASCGLIPKQAPAQNAGPYTPDQVYFILHQAIRQALNVNPADVNQPIWLNLSTVGAIVDAQDPTTVNDLADFCPAPGPVLTSYARQPKLDQTYEHVLSGIVSPLRPYSKDYEQAKALMNGPKYTAYIAAENKYIPAWKEFYEASTPGTRLAAMTKLQQVERDWSTKGYRGEIDAAINVLDSEDYRAGAGLQRRRRDLLKAYRDYGLTPRDVPGAFVSPLSRFAPGPTEWANEPSWVSVSYSNTESMKTYTQQSSRSSGFGGLSLGFVTIGGSAGGGGNSETRVDRVYELSYSFELLRVRIQRPWFDETVFFRPQQWTWKTLPNTKQFPYIAVERDSIGLPVASPTFKYDNASINCELLPVELVIARKRKITATMTKSDYQQVKDSGSAGGGGSLFGIIGGAGKKSWNSTVTHDNGNTVTFEITADGIAVIGLLSQFVPQAPAPNVNDKWPANAWLPAPAVAAAVHTP